MSWFNFLASPFSKRVIIWPHLRAINIFLLDYIPSTTSNPSLISSLSFVTRIKLFFAALSPFRIILILFHPGLLNLV